MGRLTLQGMLEADNDHPVYIVFKKLEAKTKLKLSEVRQGLRVMTNYFLKNIIISSLLTSSKLDKTTVKHHLERARESDNFVNDTGSHYGF